MDRDEKEFAKARNKAIEKAGERIAWSILEAADNIVTAIWDTHLGKKLLDKQEEDQDG